MNTASMLDSVARCIRRIVPARFRPYVYLEEYVKARCGLRVRSGPFRNMRYVGASIGSQYLPKLLGTYERELHAVVEEIVARKPPRILNIGAAEGYYAVGLALRLPDSRVIAYEQDLSGQALLRSLARTNQVGDRIEVRGRFDRACFAGCGEGSCIVCDVDGVEDDLFVPAPGASLVGACMLIECHERARPGVTRRIADAFAGTHQIRRVEAVPRSLEEFPFRRPPVCWMPARYREWAVNEIRSDGCTWLWMTPKPPCAKASP